MKEIFRWMIFLTALLGSQAEARDPISTILPENYGEVVFIRQESSGILNILLATIRCEDWPRIILTGGDVASVYLVEGSYRFQVFSPEPWVRESSPVACESPVLRVHVRKRKRIFVEVIPEVPDEGSTAKFHWKIIEVSR